MRTLLPMQSNIEIPNKFIRHSKIRTEIVPRDFLIIIFSFKRATLLYKTTMKMLDMHLSKARRVIVVSDDDPTIPEYEKLFGKENLYIINKDKCQEMRPVDLGDAYSFKNVISWARNSEFQVARDLGYKYFVTLEDDYSDINIRAEYKCSLISSSRRSLCFRFDESAEVYFKLLDSAPFLNCVAMAQAGDYINGKCCDLVQNEYKLKAMNIIFYRTDREYEFSGRINEDATAYIHNNRLGRLSLTLYGHCLVQGITQANAGGATDIYKKGGTWLKSIYSVMFSPDCCSIGNLKWRDARVHHRVDWKYNTVKIIPVEYAKKIIPFNECIDDRTNGVFGRWHKGQKDFSNVDLDIKNAIINDKCIDEW